MSGVPTNRIPVDLRGTLVTCIVCKLPTDITNYCQVCKRDVCPGCLTDHWCGRPLTREMWSNL